jgi:F0F1-type ATP synthase membrane subunit a
LFNLFSKNEIKFIDRIFFIFFLRNTLGLSAFFISFSLWPSLIIFLSIRFWFQNIFNLIKVSFLNFLSHFSQENLIILITCFIVYIEILRITIRFLTLAFRLLANILGGHLIIELANTNSGNIFLLVGVFSYEIFVSTIQATIYRILIYYYTLESLEKF